MPTELVLTALQQALTPRQPAPGLIIYADRGSQYASQACRARIEATKAVPSFSRPGNPCDNARPRPPFPGTAFASLEEVRLEVACYLNTHSNPDRRHSALGYRSPHQFELDLLNHLP